MCRESTTAAATSATTAESSVSAAQSLLLYVAAANPVLWAVRVICIARQLAHTVPRQLRAAMVMGLPLVRVLPSATARTAAIVRLLHLAAAIVRLPRLRVVRHSRQLAVAV